VTEDAVTDSSDVTEDAVTDSSDGHTHSFTFTGEKDHNYHQVACSCGETKTDPHTYAEFKCPVCESQNYFQYTTKPGAGTCSIYGLSECYSVIVVPAVIDGCRVTSIGPNAFSVQLGDYALPRFDVPTPAEALRTRAEQGGGSKTSQRVEEGQSQQSEGKQEGKAGALTGKERGKADQGKPRGKHDGKVQADGGKDRKLPGKECHRAADQKDRGTDAADTEGDEG
jgi:hypothetical protein